jgi:hypothetical protein
MPTTDGGKLTFVNNMIDLVTAAPTSWGITAGIVTQLTSYRDDYETKLAAATEPATKSRANTFAKNQARDLMVSYIRDSVVPPIQGSAVVTDQMKHDLDITIRGANPRTPIQAPTEVPVATIRKVDGWTTDVQITTAGSERRGLPDGVAGINIYSYAGATPPADPLLWTYEGESSKSRFKIAAPPETPVGTKIFYTFCFKNPRFQVGPACAGVPVVVGGGVPETNVG